MNLFSITTRLCVPWLACAACLAGLASAVTAAESAPPAAASLQLSTFRADITPPLGEGACIGFMPKISTIEHPLEARGIILRRGGDTWAVVALDYQGLCNASDDLFRQRLAEAIGTTPDQVAIQSLHQHTAPALDLDGAELLYAEQPRLLAAHRKLNETMSARVAQAAKDSLARLQPVTRVVESKAKVDRVASNRRVPQPDGTLAVRGSSTRDPALRAAPEGLIDPWLRTVTFFNADTRQAQLHYYATHPQSFYGDQRISWDVPGIAREQFEQQTGVFQIYFTGCGGNIGMGKYNSGTRDDRAALAARLLDAMRASTNNPADRPLQIDVASLAAGEIEWSTTPVQFTPRVEPEFRDETLLAQLAADSPLAGRIKAAMYLAWSRRMRAGHSVSVSRLRIGPLQIVHLPGEPFVEFQLFAQQQARGGFVCVAGYGECGMWYYGPDSIFTDRGGYEQTWSLTGPCQAKVESALTTLLTRPDPKSALRRWRVRVDPMDIGQRQRDELPAEAVIDVGDNEAIDISTLRVSRVVAERREPPGANDALNNRTARALPLESDAARIPFRWYEAAIPYDFPEFQDSVSRTAGNLRPKPRERGGYYLNSIGDGRKGRLVWMHTQLGNEPAWYEIEAELLAPGEVPPHLPPQGWIGDGQARCAETSTQAVHSDHLRIDVTDWDGDGLIDLVVGDDCGHLVWWPNLSHERGSPPKLVARGPLQADDQTLNVGHWCASPCAIDIDAAGDLDLLSGHTPLREPGMKAGFACSRTWARGEWEPIIMHHQLTDIR